MTWLLPSALIIGGIAALAAVAVHFVARRRPMAEPFPTARFIPRRASQARVTTLAFSDLALLLLRMFAIAAIALGVAAPEFAGARGRVTRIIVVDRSRAVGDPRAARDSVRPLARSGDIIIAFDSTARMVSAVDTAPDGARGSISAGLAAAERAAAAVSASADSVELILVSAFTNEETDSATTHIRAAWPGRARLIALPPARAASWRPGVVVHASTGDALRAGLALAGLVRDTGAVHIERSEVAPADSAWARQPGNVLVHWPAGAGDARWPARPTVDAIGGVATSDGTTLVGRFPRVWRPLGTPVARWADGEVAAGETRSGGGCLRDVGILIDPASDLTLRPSFRSFATALLGPCGGTRDSAPIDSTSMAILAGAGPLASASSLAENAGVSSPSSAWFILVGAGLLILELALRRPARRAVA